MTRIFIAVGLAWFGYQTSVVLDEHGYSGFFELAQANTASGLLLLDVSIFVVLASVWIWHDARRPRVAAPFIALAAAFGAAGPLLYLLLRPWLRAGEPATAGAGGESARGEI